MKGVVLGLMVGAGLVVVGAVPSPSQDFARRPAISGAVTRADGELAVLSTVVTDKYQQVVIVDPKTRVMSVYHVELATGMIQLRSVRNIHWDLQMMEFNGASPSPREIQSQIQPLVDPR